MKIKKDKFRSSRGGNTKILEIKCSKCGSFICLYQKDGAGNLLRMYLDRIIEPAELRQKKVLRCPNCREICGHQYIYEKEKRKAFRLNHESLKKNIKKI